MIVGLEILFIQYIHNNMRDKLHDYLVKTYFLPFTMYMPGVLPLAF